MVTSENGIINRTNQAALGLLGYAKKELLNKSIDICFSNESEARWLVEHLRKHGSITAAERTFIAKDGRNVRSPFRHRQSLATIPGQADLFGWCWISPNNRQRRTD